MNTSLPITVSDSTASGQFTTSLRYVLTAIGAYALGRGWIESDLLELLTAVLTVLAPTIWGLWRTYVHKKQLVTLARYAPPSVGQVKEKA